jgi:sodium/potassium/calcium exchanger 6
VHSEEVEAEVEAEIEHFIPSQRLKLCIHLFYKYCIEWPCAIPRMLTIPILEEDRWSRPLAIASCSLAPVFVAALWAFRNGMPSTALEWAALGISFALGSILGLLAFFTTDNDKPPERFVWLWLAGSFFMSIVWFYFVANELVATLESLGLAFSIDSTILGLTVLAWGNSIGDVVANITLALTGRNGVQIAIAGCYAGPLFNIVVGLGISLLVVSWRASPDPFLVTGNDRSVFFMLGFFAAGLVWGLLVMSVRGVRLSRVHGVGLILLYCSFLIVALAYAIGWI